MASPVDHLTAWETTAWIDPLQEIPILYEDEDEGDMGEINMHVVCDEILHVCLRAHMRERQPGIQVFSNMNLYYRDEPLHPVTRSAPYVSPDAMAVKPYQELPETTRSYKIGRDGPAPLLAGEILSERSAQQRDLDEKLVVYRLLGVREYVLVDETGKHLRERLLLKRLGADGQYHDQRDADGGVTSELGFRLVFEPDGLRVIDARTGQRYVRPMEAEEEAKARRQAEEARRQAEQALREAEQSRVAEAQARRAAEDQLAAAQQQLLSMQAELDRIRENK